MDNEEYNCILNDLKDFKGPSINDNIYKYLAKKYNNVPEHTLRSIIALWYQRKMSSNASKIKGIDIIKMYKEHISSGNKYACLSIANDLDYSPALIAKIVVTHYVTERNKNRVIKSKKLCDYCKANKIAKSKKKTEMSNSIGINEKFTLKRHSDPRVELILNLFDEDDEVGKYFLEKFKYSGKTKILQSQNDSYFDSIKQPIAKKFYSEGSNFEKIGEKNVMLTKNIERLFLNTKNNDESISLNKNLEKNFSVNAQINQCDNTNENSINNQINEFNFSSENVNKSSSITHENLCSSSPFVTEDNKTLKYNYCTCYNKPDSSESDSDPENSEEFFENLSVRELLENASWIEDPVLANDVFQCTISDDHFGSISDVITNTSGVTYEYLLEDCVKKAGLPYQTENNLRDVGVDKTPDIVLLVPVAVNGFIINWIESKALFADYKVHEDYMKYQFKNYINRFGCGLVIYWHGYLNDILKCCWNKQLILRDNFPSKESFTFVNSGKFKSWMQLNKKM